MLKKRRVEPWAISNDDQNSRTNADQNSQHIGDQNSRNKGSEMENSSFTNRNVKN